MKIKKKTIVIDMDGTICSEEKTFDKFFATPKENAINVINELYDEFFIIIYTARGWSEFNTTKQWLETHKINFDLLICGKPIYDFWIDDRSINFNNNWDIIKQTIL